ncbi:MAG TPA: nucleotidyltransferase family protein [Gemmatimonadales bacterium]
MSAGATTDRAVKAVVLARGLGTRMRRADASAALDEGQRAAADAGLKGMVPIGAGTAGRPFMDYALSALADAGYREACLVIGPEHDAVRDHYAHARPERIAVSFAVQERPRGTADAVLAAEEFARGEPFLVVNSDNYYPVETLAALREAPAPALAGFDRHALARGGNIEPARIASFALLEATPDGTLQRIVEKPDEATMRALGEAAMVSMNCWLLTPAIFEACRSIAPSPRGELELPDAVRWLMDERGARFHVVPSRGPVLDMSSRADIPAVVARLTAIDVRP